MPDLPDSTPPDPLLDWESREAFRATYLIHFPPEHADTLQRHAQILYDYALEKPEKRPELRGPWTLWEVLAALSEMRFIEGYLRSVFEEHRISSLSPEVEKLSRMAGGMAWDLSEVTRTYKGELAKWQRKHGSK